MAQEYTSNKDFTGTSTGKRLLDKYLKINPWTRIPAGIIERFLEERKAKEGFDYVPLGPLKPVKGRGGSGKESDPVRLPNIIVSPSQLTLPLRLPFSPDFIVRPSSPVLTAKKGSRLISKHLLGNSLRLRSQRTSDYFRDNIFPYLEWIEARNLSGKSWDNYTWTGKPVREYDDSRDPASYNPYLTTMVPVKNSLGQNGFLEVNPYFFDGYQETFHPENGEDSWYPKIKEDYDKLMKSGWNSREWAKDHSWHPLIHYRKLGGLLTKRTLLKYLTGGTFRFGGEYFTFPEGSLNQLQLEFLNKYQDKKYQGTFGASDKDEYEFYLGWEKAFGPYEPSNSTYGGYYVDDLGKVQRAKYNNGLWSVDTTKYKVYTTPLNYSKDNGYYFKVGDNIYNGGRYR